MDTMYFNSPAGWEVYKQNLEEYGTNDYEIIEKCQKAREKDISVEVEQRTNEEIQRVLPEIQERERKKAVRQVRSEYRNTKGEKLSIYRHSLVKTSLSMARR